MAAAIGGEVDDALRGEEPAAPFFLVDGDAVQGFDGSAGERVRGWEADGDLQELVVEGDAGGDFAAVERGDFDVHGLVRRGVIGSGLGWCPVADGLELGSEYHGGDL